MKVPVFISYPENDPVLADNIARALTDFETINGSLGAAGVDYLIVKAIPAVYGQLMQSLSFMEAAPQVREDILKRQKDAELQTKALHGSLQLVEKLTQDKKSRWFKMRVEDLEFSIPELYSALKAIDENSPSHKELGEVLQFFNLYGFINQIPGQEEGTPSHKLRYRFYLLPEEQIWYSKELITFKEKIISDAKKDIVQLKKDLKHQQALKQKNDKENQLQAANTSAVEEPGAAKHSGSFAEATNGDSSQE